MIVQVHRPNAVLNAVRRGASISRHVRRACLSSIATPCARGSIGRHTKKYVNNVPPSYATRPFLRTLRQRKTVPLLPTNACKVVMLHLASARDFNVRTNLRLCVCESGVVRYRNGSILSMLRKKHL
jgi:hypothetical protein